MWINRLLVILSAVLIAGCSDEIDPDKVDFSGLYDAEIVTHHWNYAPSYSSWETRETTEISVIRKSGGVYRLSIAPEMDFTLSSYGGDSLVFGGIRGGYPYDYSFTYYEKNTLIKGHLSYATKLSGKSRTFTAKK